MLRVNPYVRSKTGGIPNSYWGAPGLATRAERDLGPIKYLSRIADGDGAGY